MYGTEFKVDTLATLEVSKVTEKSVLFQIDFPVVVVYI